MGRLFKNRVLIVGEIKTVSDKMENGLNDWHLSNFRLVPDAMKCPYCRFHTADIWRPLFRKHGNNGLPEQDIEHCLYTKIPDFVDDTIVKIWLYWMQCQAEHCQEILVKAIREEKWLDLDGTAHTNPKKSWLVIPAKPTPPVIDSLVEDPYKTDYREASAILDDSHRMSAVLSRKMLTELLAQYAGLDQHNLKDAIDAFNKDTRHPRHIRKNLHMVRTMGNVVVHIKKDTEGQVLEVTKEEAEWTLKVIEDLFSYFIIEPKKSEQARSKFSQKLEDAGEKPLDQLPDDGNGGALSS